MLRKKIVLLIFASLFQMEPLHALEVVNKNVFTGAINGERRVGDTVIIKQVISNDIFSYVIGGPSENIDYLTFQDASLIKYENEKIMLRKVEDLTEGQKIVTTMIVGILVNGTKKKISISEEGNKIKFVLPNNANSVRMYFLEPVEIRVPSAYRGEFSLSFEIEAINEDID